ncbi:putative ubiquitin carboxyl-terminal hydrolase [Penicillium brasilianum]|uniref:ubiquitinyl hydrolase 1 n=1 Tax=Penicillium brasilianum TaxID=104259 RepID=A0A1S9RAN8_PENBI|nr:putative ubiquitin carboxyl-terminal hydrolase [Penicillium brasilianum]
MVPPQRPGKTAPRLAEDIRLYDPVHLPGTGLNLLSQVPPVHPEDSDKTSDFVSPHACRHTYVTKENQTYLAKAEQKRRPGTSSKLSAICSKCRYHLQVVVNYTTSGNAFALAKPTDHLHHFVYKSGRQQGSQMAEEVTEKGQVVETYHYQCSHLSCSAMVSLRIMSPLITLHRLELLSNPGLIRERAEEAIAAQPERLEGMAIPAPVTVLDNLRLYLHNALHTHERSKAISSANKRFMLSFGLEGTASKDVLEFLGFSYDAEAGSWQPPSPNPWTAKPYQDAERVFLDDIIHELLCLLHQRPASEKRGVNFPVLPPLSTNDLSYALEAEDYPKAARAHEFAMPPAPFYEDLGVTEDMAASAIIEAYNRQVSLDPARAPLYLQCLKAIATLRGGEDYEIIEPAVALAYSEGKYTDDDLVDSYRYFGLWYNDYSLDADAIIGKFYAYLSSTSPERENETRRHLWRIGASRSSERIKAVSEARVSTVEQAQVFLGVEDNTPDDFIITMYTTKINDNPSCKELANRALKLIAESRNSNMLNHYHATGETLAAEMDIGDAYRLLQIPDRTADDGAIMAAYTICVDENPDQAEVYNRALTIIAKNMDSPMLRNMAGISSEPDRNPLEWPVGLQNIGNTCYLNSLLQFYFSVRPFRDMVMHFEKYQMDVNDESSMARKQVGSRKVAKKEVERSLKFLGELRGLFDSMITSAQSSVTPGQELARLTLISPGGEAAIRRRSTFSKSQTLGDVDGRPILGPLGPPRPIAEEQSEEQIVPQNGTPVSKASNPSDIGSDATLVSEAIPMAASAQEDRTGGPLSPPASDTDGDAFEKAPTPLSPEPPSNPPPVPPRPIPEVDRQKQLIEEVEIGAQQDVTEVINNVLFQSQCAIKPLRIDSDGEQVDQIKDLFYGRTRSYITTAGGTRSKEERWCDIKVDVAGGSRDIYAAIDGAFDVQKISVENGEAEQYGAITTIPPILQIQVQRVQFDPVKKSSFKSTHHLDLLQNIYLDRYMDTTKPEIMNRRRQCWEWKSKLKLLEARRAELLRKQEDDHLEMTELFRHTKTVLEDVAAIEGDSSLDIKPELLNELDQLCQTVQSELQSVDQDIQNIHNMLSKQFSEFTKLPYRLYAVFVHHGSVSFGHYWIYIHDFRKDVWRKYNDEYVTEVQNLDEIFKNTDTKNPPTPYFLVYINDTMKDRLVDPVCRDIPEWQTDAVTEDTEEITAMEDIQSPGITEDVDMEPPSYQEASTDQATLTTESPWPTATEEKQAYQH